MEHLPPVAFAAALASVPSLGPRGLRTLLDTEAPEAAWEMVRRADAPIGPRALRAATEARQLDPGRIWEAHRDAGIEVHLRGHQGYPQALCDDHEAPAVLFSLGVPTMVDRHPRVAIVGTRSATRYGLSVAGDLGRALAAAGVAVVSGLALGIDGAAHEGALSAHRAGERSGPAQPPGPPVAVVAGSLAEPYPRRHAGLWGRVAGHGAVVSEAPLGVADLSWRFPQRNRIIAALAQVVVVVECHARGGSLHTVAAAAKRGITVGAVPGSVRSPASTGTNHLLADGCTVIRDPDDVLVALGLASAGSGSGAGVARAVELLPTDADPDERALLEAIGWERCTLDALMERTGLTLDRCAAALERLAGRGLVVGSAGWWERR